MVEVKCVTSKCLEFWFYSARNPYNFKDKKLDTEDQISKSVLKILLQAKFLRIFRNRHWTWIIDTWGPKLQIIHFIFFKTNYDPVIVARAKLKKLLIPILIMVKLFKLKLLLFLPLILGLASFKKFLGFLAIIIPGLIGFFKLCKPDLHHNYGNFGHSSFYHRPPHQYGSLGRPDHTLYVNEYRGTESPDVIQYLYDTYAGGNQDYYAKSSAGKSTGSSVAFRDDPQKLAYNTYQQKRKWLNGDVTEIVSFYT